MRLFRNIFKLAIEEKIEHSDFKHNEILEEEEVQTGDMFTSKEHYLEFKAAFKAWASEKKWLATHHFLLYAILRGRDWTKGFAPDRFPKDHGSHKYKMRQAFYNIKSSFHQESLLEPFGGTITTGMLKRIRNELDTIQKQGD